METTKQNGINDVELETFLEKDTKKLNAGGDTKNGFVKAYIVPRQDQDKTKPLFRDDFDPFSERQLRNPTSDCDTVTHLLKASLGTGILAMPVAFRNSGLILGIFGTVLVSLICTHCAYILVKCAHELYRRKRVTSMTFAEVSMAAFESGPAATRKLAKPSRVIVQISLFMAYFGCCSVYAVLTAENFLEVVSYHTGLDASDINVKRMAIAITLVPFVLISWVPDLKYLAPFSMMANIFMGVGLVITVYYLVIDLPPVDTVAYVAPVHRWPQFLSITIFAMEAIGVVMPLENSMKTPQHFTGICGVLNRGMSGVTMVYILVGFLGYVRYGDAVVDSITLSLQIQLIGAQIVRVLIGLAVICTFGLQFYVCLDIGWNEIKDRFAKRQTMAKYTMRTIMTILCVMLAVAVPTIGPFMGLIGALCFSLLGLVIPIVIEMVTLWEKGFGAYHWVAVKNVFLFAFGLMVMVFGSWLAIQDIARLYS